MLKYYQEKHLPVVEWIWSSSPISDTKKKVLYGDTVISCRKAVISGGPRQVLSRRAAIPAVNLTSAFLTSAFVPARFATCWLRASHFICLCRFLSNSNLRFHHVKVVGDRGLRVNINSLFVLIIHQINVIHFVFYVVHTFLLKQNCILECLRMEIFFSCQVWDDLCILIKIEFVVMLSCCHFMQVHMLYHII